ncbi:unnamed protein product [Arctogadus glacialis]
MNQRREDRTPGPAESTPVWRAMSGLVCESRSMGGVTPIQEEEEWREEKLRNASASPPRSSGQSHHDKLSGAVRPSAQHITALCHDQRWTAALCEAESVINLGPTRSSEASGVEQVRAEVDTGRRGAVYHTGAVSAKRDTHLITACAIALCLAHQMR